MTKKDRALIKYTKNINQRRPRNGGEIMDHYAFERLAKRLCKENKTVLDRLANS